MVKWIGIICVLLGIICMLSAVGFVTYNRWEAKTGGNIAQDMLTEVQGIMGEIQQERPQPEKTVDFPNETVSVPNETEKLPLEMETVEVNGYDCIGVISVPALELELPVLADWSDAKLKKAPCHYYGSYYEKNFVIAAHNYTAHFGKLSLLQAGDLVVFTDVSGADHFYEVVLLETLSATATEEMIASGFDLSLFTCTYGGSNRITVRCNAAENGS